MRTLESAQAGFGRGPVPGARLSGAKSQGVLSLAGADCLRQRRADATGTCDPSITVPNPTPATLPT